MQVVGSIHSQRVYCRNNNTAPSTGQVLLLVTVLIAQNAGRSHGQAGLQDRLSQVKEDMIRRGVSSESDAAVKAKAALKGLQIPVTNPSPPPAVAKKNRLTRQQDGDVKFQLSQLGLRAAQSKASNKAALAEKKVHFTPPPLPGVGGPLGKRRAPQGAQEMAEHALRKAQHPNLLRQDLRQTPEKSANPAKLKADFEAAARAVTNAMHKKQRLSGAQHSNEL